MTKLSNILNEIFYDDGTDRYEYAILSNRLRVRGIKQYLDNSKFHGFLFLNDQIKDSFKDYVKKYWSTEYHIMNSTLK